MPSPPFAPWRFLRLFKRQALWVRNHRQGLLYTLTDSPAVVPPRNSGVRTTVGEIKQVARGKLPLLAPPPEHDDPWSSYADPVTPRKLSIDRTTGQGIYYDKSVKARRKAVIAERRIGPLYEHLTIQLGEVVDGPQGNSPGEGP